MIKSIINSDDLNFLKENFDGLFSKMLPYLDGNEIKIPDDETYNEIDGEFNDAIIGEYDDDRDYMSDKGVRLEDIWSFF